MKQKINMKKRIQNENIRKCKFTATTTIVFILFDFWNCKISFLTFEKIRCSRTFDTILRGNTL